MKRFFEKAEVAPCPDGLTIKLDGKLVRTPGRAPLLVSTSVLAEAIADEWNGQSGSIDPRSMPLTGLANAAIDKIGPNPESFAHGLALYGESDLVCYRAEGPAPLVRRQQEHWDPILDWAVNRYDVAFETAVGIIHRPQPAATIERLGQAVRGLTSFQLAGLSPLVTVSGSLLVALALFEQSIALEAAWAAASLEEQWQIDQWGDDPEAVKALAGRRFDFEAGARFLALL